MKILFIILLVNSVISDSPALPATAPTTISGPAMPAVTPKLCAFNRLAAVPASDKHQFKITKAPADASQSYTNANFEVDWKQLAYKDHSFFRIIKDSINIRKTLDRLSCVAASKQDFGKVCNYGANQVQQYFNNAFGDKKVYKCKVPDNNFVTLVRFVLQLSDFKIGPGGRWSVFTGFQKFKSNEDAKKTIQRKINQVANNLKRSKLNTFDINSNLNIIPDFIKGTLSWEFNNNKNSDFIKNIKLNQPNPLSDVAFIKILPPSTEFILGGIYNGTRSVYQVCDNFRFSNPADSCNLEAQPFKKRQSHSDSD